MQLTPSGEQRRERHRTVPALATSTLLRDLRDLASSPHFRDKKSGAQRKGSFTGPWWHTQQLSLVLTLCSGLHPDPLPCAGNGPRERDTVSLCGHSPCTFLTFLCPGTKGEQTHTNYSGFLVEKHS